MIRLHPGNTFIDALLRIKLLKTYSKF